MREIRVGLIRDYVAESIELARQGVEIKPLRNRTVMVPDILSEALQEDPRAAQAFATLTPGKQREFAEYIREAQRDTTKQNRLNKIIPMIRQGVGLNDHYRR